jgi:hypothetical protein
LFWPGLLLERTDGQAPQNFDEPQGKPLKETFQGNPSRKLRANAEEPPGRL